MSPAALVPGPARRRGPDLLEALRRTWQALDPPPPDLAERVLAAVAADDLDLELVLLTDDALALAGARGAEPMRTLTFSGESVAVMVRASPSRRHRFRLDGWVAPWGAGRVEVHHFAGRVVGTVDAQGRFVLFDVPAGRIQLVYHPFATDGGSAPRSVVAPAVHL